MSCSRRYIVRVTERYADGTRGIACFRTVTADTPGMAERVAIALERDYRRSYDFEPLRDPEATASESHF